MENITIKIYDAQSGEVVEREMNAEELRQWELDQVNAEIKAVALAEIGFAKAALLKRLGITEEEAKLLLS